MASYELPNGEFQQITIGKYEVHHNYYDGEFAAVVCGGLYMVPIADIEKALDEIVRKLDPA